MLTTLSNVDFSIINPEFIKEGILLIANISKSIEIKEEIKDKIEVIEMLY
jgi:hypothetical protein